MIAPGLPVYCACNSGNPGKLLPAVGTILKSSLPMRAAAWLIAKTDANCLCRTVEEKMNRLGPDGCEAKMDEIVEDIRKSAAAASLLWMFSRLGVRSLVMSAINSARKENDVIQPMP
jgi:hypothetical protein